MHNEFQTSCPFSPGVVMEGGREEQLNSEDMRTVEAELREIYRNTPSHVRDVVSEIVKRTGSEFADQFYRVMIVQPGAHFYLDHEAVSKKLRQSLKHWLADVFQRDIKDVELFTRRQMQVGWAHARIRIPEKLILRGARELKQTINGNLRATRLSREDLASAVQFVSTMFDLALDVMTRAYINRSERNVRSGEAFRLFSLNRNLAAERERQRAALSEWAQTLLFDLQIGSDPVSIRPVAQSDFGLWMLHRAPLLFDRSSEYNRLLNIIVDIDGSAEALRSSGRRERIDHLRRIRRAIEEMNSLVGLLFDRSLDVQGARDPSTQLLNRKFVDTVISAEIETQKMSHHPFSILLIEIDRFDDLQVRLGDEGADIVALRTAQMIFDAVRSSDSVFSMGRERFLIVKVETVLAAANRFAGQLAERYASTHFTVNGKAVLECSLSIGVIEYDGHPDPRELIDRAHRELSERKARRNPRAG